MQTLKIAADSNCFINAVNVNSHSYRHLEEIFKLRDLGRITIMVSLHTLHEVKEPQAAIDLAKSCQLLPHYLIGTFDEQIATISQLAGTLNDAKRNQEIQTDIASLAKSGTDIRDRGAYVDALCSRVDVFMTSDRQLVGGGPALRIAEKYGLRILTPKQVCELVK